MATKQQPANLTDRFNKSIEHAQARLSALEEEAQKMVQDVIERSRASRKEMATLVARINAGELLDKRTVKEWQGKARHVSDDVHHRIEDLRGQVIAFAGVASRDQVDDLAKDLDKLSRKLDRLLTSKKKEVRS